MPAIDSERQLIATALALGARRVPGWSQAETALGRDPVTVPRKTLARVQNLIQTGRDPLGDAFCQLRSPAIRRQQGATYTPRQIVKAMVTWAAKVGTPVRVVDPGVGSARFIVAAGRRFQQAKVIGVDIDPLAALVARGHLAAAGMTDRAEIIVGDYRDLKLPDASGRTLYIGNPPYVRHHLISPEWKAWFTRTAEQRGLEASQLSGLYVHFVLATSEFAKLKDFGAFITAAEWLDVNYGRLYRELFLGPLGGRSITLIEPTAQPFPDAATTATITCFEAGARSRTIRLKRAAKIADATELEVGGRLLRRERLETAARWTPLTRIQRKTPEGFIELGELCRVHRGQVTGFNRVWIAGDHSKALPTSVLYASVTKGLELFRAVGVLRDATKLRRVIDLPVDLDAISDESRRAIDTFLKFAKRMGAHKGYVARNRKSWWSVGLREPAPILASYMARRPPAFVRNLANARHINIAHGLYPREPLSEAALETLQGYLSKSVGISEGRTYAGGLTKFEPKEMERLVVPDLDQLNASPALPWFS